MDIETKYIDGIEVGGLVSNESVFLEQVENTKDTWHYEIAKAFLQGKIIYIQSGFENHYESMKLVAQSVMNKRLPIPKVEDLKNNINFRNHVKNQLILHLKRKDIVGLHFRINMILHHCTSAYFALLGFTFPPWKRVGERLGRESEMYRLCLSVFEENDLDLKVKKVWEVIDYINDMAKKKIDDTSML